ncbi:MAG TPA: hydrogenase maturation protease [Bryobacteraceae bacterium]|jgi:hydrogenase maturation protease
MNSLRDEGKRVLIACIGNIFLGDDGFGTEVACRLADRPLPSAVVLEDFGIRGIDLTYALLNPYELVILVDACSRGGHPGTIYLVEPDEIGSNMPNDVPARLETHSMNPMNVLRAVHSMGGAPGRILIVGCEPGDLGDEEGKLGLSDAVSSAVDEAVALIETLISTALRNEPAHIAVQLN